MASVDSSLPEEGSRSTTLPMAKPTYFIPPTFHNPPDGPLKLGQLIVAVDDPGNALDKPESLVRHNIEVYENSQTVESHGYTTVSTTDLGLFARAAHTIAARFGVSLSRQQHASILSHIERFQIRFIQPDDNYVKASLLREKVQEKLKFWLWQKQAYMITGLCIAHPSVEMPDRITVENSSRRRTEGKFETKGPSGVGSATGAGGHVSTQDISSHHLKLIPRQPFVYAFQLRTCRYGRRRITNRPATDGAVMSEQKVRGERDIGLQKEDPESFEFVYDEVAEEDVSLDELGLDAEGLGIVAAKDDVTGGSCDIIVPCMLVA